MIPLALSLLWGRFLMAGVISGVTLAVLLHVTRGPGGDLAGLPSASSAIARRAPRLARALAFAVACGSLALFVWLSLG